MKMYTGFAGSYDLFMDNVPYDEWSEYIAELLKKYGINDGLILELGCGTGNITQRLASYGYDMIGIDNSEDMLCEAMEKKYESGYDILYLNQDMREFELYGTVGAVICVCDSINYILKEDELLEVFGHVNNYLDPGGIFIFDMNTASKYRAIGDAVIAENREDASFIWENTYFEDSGINRYDITVFSKGNDGRYDKYEETHFQRGYEPEKIVELINKSGLKYIESPETLPGDDGGRVMIVAAEVQKEKKV